MPSVLITNKNLPDLVCEPGKGKTDYRDAGCKGLLLEARVSGNRTWYLRYTDMRGIKRQFRIADVADLKLEQARKRADELRGEIAMGGDPRTAKIELRQIPTLAEFVEERYLPYIQGYKRSWHCDVSYLKNHLLPTLGKKHLDQISKAMVIEFHHGMSKNGYAPGTCNRGLILLRYILNLAIRWEITGLKKNPTSGVPLLKENNAVERYLTKDEAAALYRHVCESSNPMLKFIVPMLILTGARKREALDSRWEDFDPAQRLWRIPMSKSGKARYVPLSDGAVQILEAVRAEQMSWPKDANPGGWVFPNIKTGKPFESIFRSWDTARIAAGLPEVRMHDLRHSFASMLVNNGRSLYEVQRILGHAQIQMTQRYAHLAQHTLLEAANTAGNSLGDMFATKPLAPPKVVNSALTAA